MVKELPLLQLGDVGLEILHLLELREQPDLLAIEPLLRIRLLPLQRFADLLPFTVNALQLYVSRESTHLRR